MLRILILPDTQEPDSGSGVVGIGYWIPILLFLYLYQNIFGEKYIYTLLLNQICFSILIHCTKTYSNSRKLLTSVKKKPFAYLPRCPAFLITGYPPFHSGIRYPAGYKKAGSSCQPPILCIYSTYVKHLTKFPGWCGGGGGVRVR